MPLSRNNRLKIGNKTLERERLYAYKSDYDAGQKHIQSLEKKIHEFHSEYDDQLADFKKSILEFNKRVTEVAKTLANIVKENEDLSNAAQMASAAQDLLNSCSVKLAATDKEIQKVHKIIETKISNDDFYKGISKKMDRTEVSLLVTPLDHEHDWVRRRERAYQRLCEEGDLPS